MVLVLKSEVVKKMMLLSGVFLAGVLVCEEYERSANLMKISNLLHLKVSSGFLENVSVLLFFTL